MYILTCILHACLFPGDCKLSEGRAHMCVTLPWVLHSVCHVLPISDDLYNYLFIERKNTWRNPKMETKIFLKKSEKVLLLPDGCPQLPRMNNIDRIKWTECPG